MKNVVFSWFLLFTTLMLAQTPKEIFSKGNELYKNGDYLKAIDSYKSIEDEGLESDALYFNLGNCYYKLNKVAPAIYYYEKALKINPENQKVITNLSFAKRMTIDVIDALPKIFWQKFSTAIIQKFSFNTWAIIAVVASFLVAIFFLLYYFSYSSTKKLMYFNTSLISLAVLVISLFFAIENYKQVQKNRTAIIFATKVEAKSAPSVNSDEVFELHEGTKVMVLDELDNWKQIKLSDGKTGWISADDLKEI
jgi:tetratricopeptide (TPR) repeat protein